MSKIDILEHKLVPNHELMTDSEIEEELGDADFEIENLPKIKIDDPVVEDMQSRDINVKEGNILRITRDSQTAGTFVTYRIVEE
ncbi:MAG: DNA-directed RNA polymerase subunit H [Methanobrevibacter sp.]|nr:DNA-directed RNA polymerase subunit H [Methanobrevibacter sp.]